MERLRIATWNLWWRFGPWEARQPLIAAELDRIDADVVCLQEVWAETDRPNPPAPEVVVDGPGDAVRSQAAALAAGAGYPHHRMSWRYAHDGLAFGNAILSRWPLAATDAFPLPGLDQYEEHRTALRVEVATPAGLVPVATTHLNFLWDQSHVRQAQVEAVCQWLAAAGHRDLPTILTGDLNADPSSDEIRMLTGRRRVPAPGLGFFDAWEVVGDGAGHTWTRENVHAAALTAEPDRRIDYVLLGYPWQAPRGTALHAERFGTATTDGLHPSDHFGVLVDVRL
jgi:endonuclease/exonuclease/phosphatase family metal-dependent hydrolase